MSITSEQVADLREGDVVELTLAPFPSVVTRGPLRDDLGFLRCGTLPVRLPSGAAGPEVGTLTVVSRAPRPLYVNHPRIKPVPGDVACDAGMDDRDPAFVWCYLGKPGLASWCDRWGYTLNQSDLSDRLRLLVDGETGQVVP